MTDLLEPAGLDHPATTVVRRLPIDDLAPQQRRVLGKMSRDDLLLLGGAAVSSLALTMLIFGRLTPLDGGVGFLSVFFLLYLVTTAVLTSLTESLPAVVDRTMTVMMAAAAATAFVALGSVVIYVFVKGWSALHHTNFFTTDLSEAGPQTPLTQGGILHAAVGTLVMTLLTIVMTVPLSVACAVYLNESNTRATRLVRTVVTAMTALPSIVAGLFIYATWILAFHQPKSGLAASIAISIMMLPIIIRSADVVLRLVPGNLREASAALGAPRWRTVWHVVLPTARSGLTTSVILGVARGVGETAPVLLTVGYTASVNYDPTRNPMVNLPLTAYSLVRAPQAVQVARGFATAAVLMLLVLILFTVARVLGGRPAGRLSKRQARRAAARSAHDEARITARLEKLEATRP